MASNSQSPEDILRGEAGLLSRILRKFHADPELAHVAEMTTAKRDAFELGASLIEQQRDILAVHVLAQALLPSLDHTARSRVEEAMGRFQAASLSDDSTASCPACSGTGGGGPAESSWTCNLCRGQGQILKSMATLYLAVKSAL